MSTTLRCWCVVFYFSSISSLFRCWHAHCQRKEQLWPPEHMCLIRRWTAGENFPPQQSSVNRKAVKQPTRGTVFPSHKVASIAIAFLAFQCFRLYNLHLSAVCNNVGSAVQDFEVITLLAKVPAAESKWQRGGISCTRRPAFLSRISAALC